MDEHAEKNIDQVDSAVATSIENDRREVEEKILELKRNKRLRKTVVTKVRHNLERLCATKGEINVENIQKEIEGLWEVLEKSLTIMDELCCVYLKIGDHEGKSAASKEADSFEADIQEAIEKAECVIKQFMMAKPEQDRTSSDVVESLPQVSNGSSSFMIENSIGTSRQRLKPIEVPVFEGDKAKFEDFWGLFSSLVDVGDEPANVKMARLRQSLTGTALEAIRGLGVTQPEYEEAKEILKTKFGGQRRQLQAYMDQLEDMPPLKSSDVQGFEKFADLVRISVVKLQAEGRDGELREGTLHSLLVKKLADRQVESYSRWLSEHSRERSVLSLRDWLKEEVKIRVEAAEMVHGVDGTGSKKSEAGGGRLKNGDKGKLWSHFTSGGGEKVKNGKPPCVLCEGNHGVWSCMKFQSMPVQDRWKVAKDKRLCFRCLASDHQGKVCTRSRVCSTNGCKKTHHVLLHDTTPVKESDDKNFVTSREGATDHRTHVSRHSEKSSVEALSLRTVPVWLKANHRKIKVNAILDDASNETFLNEEVAGALGLQEPFETVKVHVLNNEVETFQSMPVKITIESVDGQFSKDISVKTCPRKVTGDYKVEDWSESKKKWVHLKECEFAKPAKDGIVDLLIGVDNAELHYSRVDIRGEEGGPIGRLGPLGWSCIGSPDGQNSSGTRTHVIRTLLSRDPLRNRNVGPCCDVDQSIKRFWEIESCGTEVSDSRVYTEEENAALKRMKESISYDSTTCRYKIGVPWKDNRPKLQDNREVAMSRLRSTEKKLEKDEFIQREYQQTIEAYIEKGYLRRVNVDEQPPQEVWYLPHFPVIRMDKTTTKVRIVFDCSARSDGVSLNDVIHAGPKLQKELLDVLVRFRRNPVAVACDIKEMYLQVEIEESDRPMFRILWRNLDSNREPEVFEFSRVVFGKNSAPMESQFVAQENARKNQDAYPLAAETVLKSTYMDDSIDSVETDEEGIELYQQLDGLWSLAGMQARKWISNSPKVVAATPEKDRATELRLNDSQDPVVKTLGISWESKDDVLTICTKAVPTDTPLTKRNVLRKIAMVFDPLGFVSPFIVIAKILLQELWSRGYGWDDVILDEIGDRINEWFQQLESLLSLRVPRCLREAKKVVSKRVITFVDASLKAYGAIAFLHCEYDDATVSSRMIASKSKVAPLKPMTVPRLELMGAILGLRLTQHLIRILEIPMQMVIFYADSTDVLWWIRGHGRDFRPFVANRIGEIQLLTEPSQWQYVPTDQNPADLCTRGTTPSELSDCSLWWNGPKWLLEDKSKWPKMQVGNRPSQLPEVKSINRKDESQKNPKKLSCHYQRPALKEKETKELKSDDWRLEPRRYSSWIRLVRIQGRVRRVVHNMQNAEKRRNGKELLPEEIRDAEEDIIRVAQRDTFRDEYKALTTGKQIPKKSALLKLSPRLDEQGLIRSDSRLRFAEYLPYDVRFPIILPRGHWVTKLIVKYFHELANHTAGTNFVLAQINQKYWIVAAREEIREWEKTCSECNKRKNKTATQIMGPLPSIRLRFTYRAFDQAAVDYAGPLMTIQGRGKKRQKRWLCVFTCMSTRAVHLEVAWGLDTDSFLNVFARFTSRRGVPKEMISDNGTNFVGAVNELKELVSQLDKERIQRSTAHKNIKWNFNPPGAPHFGGVFEVMVKAAKKAICAVLGSGDVTDEELITACAGVESLLNSRPLTYQSADPRDDVPLTPNHFLHGQVGGDFAPENVDATRFNPRRRWRKVQELISRVWTRWLKEYLPMLNTRPKWNEVVKDLKKGDVVLVLEKDLPRGRWPLGRIVETYPGRDGHTRVAKVQCGDRTVVRPIHKLVPLQND